MKLKDVVTMRTPKGAYKVYLLGYLKTRDFNLRMVTIPDQPHRGFKTRDLAEAHLKSLWGSKKGIKKFAKEFAEESGDAAPANGMIASAKTTL